MEAVTDHVVGHFDIALQPTHFTPSGGSYGVGIVIGLVGRPSEVKLGGCLLCYCGGARQHLGMCFLLLLVEITQALVQLHQRIAAGLCNSLREKNAPSSGQIICDLHTSGIMVKYPNLGTWGSFSIATAP